MHASDLAGQMPASAAPRLPWAGLLALATAGFITILTEALPAGLLPQMAAGLGVSESMARRWLSRWAFRAAPCWARWWAGAMLSA